MFYDHYFETFTKCDPALDKDNDRADRKTRNISMKEKTNTSEITGGGNEF